MFKQKGKMSKKTNFLNTTKIFNLFHKSNKKGGE